jgi:hypothetical protein
MKIWWLILALSAGAVMAAEATTRPQTVPAAPTTRYFSTRGQRNERFRSFAQRIAVPSANMPTMYEEVATRNIFVKGDQRPRENDGGPSGGRSYSDVPTPSDLLLTGISLADNGKVAFLEDRQQNQVTIVKIGDKISTGKIVSMTLDSLDYQDAGGKVVRVNVGYNLAGGDVWGVSGSSSTQPSTQPSRTGPRGPNESMEDYLRRRRAAETAR